MRQIVHENQNFQGRTTNSSSMFGDIHFNCPSCGQRIVTDAASAGQQTPCPTCATTITVPPGGTEPHQAEVSHTNMLRRLESSWSGPVPPEAALAKPPPIPYPRSNRRGAPPAKPSAGSTPTPSHLPEGFGPRKSDGVILSTARVPFCARCGFIKANLVKSDLATKTHACTICHQPVTTRHVYSRFQIERASFVAAAVIVALACFSL